MTSDNTNANHSAITTKELRKAFAYRLDPTIEQRALLMLYAQGTRFIFNWGLTQIKDIFNQPIPEPVAEGDKQSAVVSTTLKPKRLPFPKYSEQSALLTILKQQPEFAWLKKIPAQMLQQSLKDLESAMKHFFRRVKEKKGEKAGFPRFKNRNTHDSMRFPQGFKIEKDFAYLPKIGWIKFINSRPVEGLAKQITLKRDGKHWYIFISVIINKTITPVNLSEDLFFSKASLSLSIKPDHTCISFEKSMTISHSNEDTLKKTLYLENPKFYERQLERLGNIQADLEHKKVARKTLGRDKKVVSNHQSSLTKMQDIHRSIRRRRNDFLHKWSTWFVKDYDVIIVEKLPVKEMLKDEALALAISDIGWHAFVMMLKYKCEEHGKHFFEREIDKELA